MKKVIKTVVKKAQFGKLIREGAENLGEKAAGRVSKASATLDKLPKELTEFQKMRLAKGKTVTHFNVGEQKASGALKKAVEQRVNPEAAAKKMTKAQRQAKEIEDSYRKNGGNIKRKNGGAVNYKGAAGAAGMKGSGTYKPKPGSTGKTIGKCRGGC